MSSVQSDRPLISELRLRRFRAFENARLHLNQFTVVVGRNGSGKTTLMEAFDFLQDSVSHSVLTALERRGGINSIVHRPSALRHGDEVATISQKAEGYQVTPTDVEIALRIRLPVTDVLYGFTIGQYKNRSGFRVKREILRTFPKASFSFERRGPDFYSDVRGIRPSVGPESLVLPLVAEHEKVWEMTIDAIRGLRVYDLSPQMMQVEPRIGSQQALARDGSNIGDVMRGLDRNEAEMDWIIQHLQAVTRGITRIQAGAAAGRRLLKFVQKTADRDSNFVASDMSNGTLHSLGVLVALRQSPSPSLVFVDEIEASIHTAALASLMTAADSTSLERCQVMVSSHSTDALSHETVDADNIRIVDWQDDRSFVFHIGEGARELLQPPETVGRLLRSNSLWKDDEPSTVSGDIFEVGDDGEEQ